MYRLASLEETPVKPRITTEAGLQEYGGRLKAKIERLYAALDINASNYADSNGYVIVFRRPDGTLYHEACLPSVPTGEVIYLQMTDLQADPLTGRPTGTVSNPNALREFAKMNDDGRKIRKSLASLMKEVRYLRHSHNRQKELAAGGYMPRHSF